MIVCVWEKDYDSMCLGEDWRRSGIVKKREKKDYGKPVLGFP